MVPANLGRASHALFLRLLALADAALATQLHDAEGPRPFTCSNLWGARPVRGEMAISLEETYFLRYTLLSADWGDGRGLRGQSTAVTRPQTEMRPRQGRED